MSLDPRHLRDHVVKPAALDLPGFRGDLSWLHAREGHKGRPYWPQGVSGVTLDPGLDLGHADVALVESLVRQMISPEDWSALRAVLGLKGTEARAALANSPLIRSIRISRETAARLLPVVARPYWLNILRRFPALIGAPPCVHTALLSLAYNRGSGNRALEVLRRPIEDRDWRAVGGIIRAMQQDHQQQGIRRRRRLEGDLILDALTKETG